MAAKSKNLDVGGATTKSLKQTSGYKYLSLTDIHGNGIRLIVLWICFKNFYKKLDGIGETCCKCNLVCLKNNFHKNETKKDGLNSFCKTRIRD